MSAKPRTPNGQWDHKLTPEIIEKISLAIRAGTPLKFCGPYAGVAESSFWLWLKNGRNGGRKIERELAAEVDKALAEFVVSTVADIRQNGDARTKLELLGRRLPEQFGRRDHQTVEGTVEHRHTFDPTAYTDEELETLEALSKKGIDAASAKQGELLQLPRGESA